MSMPIGSHNAPDLAAAYTDCIILEYDLSATMARTQHKISQIRTQSANLPPHLIRDLKAQWPYFQRIDYLERRAVDLDRAQKQTLQLLQNAQKIVEMLAAFELDRFFDSINSFIKMMHEQIRTMDNE